MSVGARPATKAVIITEDDFDTLKEMAKEAAEAFTYGDNTRASGAYRKTLATVYTRRLMEQIKGKSVGMWRDFRFRLNGKQVETDKTGYAVIDLVRDLGCYSVKKRLRYNKLMAFFCMAGRKAWFCHVLHLQSGRWPPCDYHWKVPEKRQRKSCMCL